LFALLALAAGSLMLTLVTPSSGASPAALSFNGTNQYVTLGTSTNLNAANFTLETWIKRTGAGIGTSTGSGGVTAIPLITKGRAEGETEAADVNYFFGIDATTGKLVADFEEAQLAHGGTSPSLNHPASGLTTIAADSTWHHVAVTYDGTWRFYLDGVADGSLAVSRVPNAWSTATNAALGSALTSTACTTSCGAAGFLQGVLDEARIWNVARATATPTIDPTLDTDGDGVPDVIDNCGGIANADQLNTAAANTALDRPGADAFGDACDDNISGDGYTNAQHIALGKDPTTYCAIMRADVDGDGAVSILDLTKVAQYFTQSVPPAPERYGQDADKKISILDLTRMAQVFTQHVTACP
jgi:hypothetical protein